MSGEGALRREVRLFFSADLTGSTAFKNSHEGDYDGEREAPAWAAVFSAFYTEFQQALEQHWAAQRPNGSDSQAPALVKAIGDEVLLSMTVESREESAAGVQAFILALREYDRRLRKDRRLSLGVKGTAWLAGFPINNHIARLDDGKEDYIGPSIDTGFRISKFSNRYRCVLSVDLCHAVLSSPTPNWLKIRFEGEEPLKGVLRGRPYPVLWAEAKEEGDDPLIKLTGIERKEVPVAEMKKYCKEFLDASPVSWLHRAYFLEGDPGYGDPPPSHIAILDTLSDDIVHEEEQQGGASDGAGDSLVSNLAEKVKLVSSICSCGRSFATVRGLKQHRRSCKQ